MISEHRLLYISFGLFYRDTWKDMIEWASGTYSTLRFAVKALCRSVMNHWNEPKGKGEGEKGAEENKQATREKLVEGAESMFSFLNAEKCPLTAAGPSSYWLIALTHCHRLSFQAAWKKYWPVWSPPKARKPGSRAVVWMLLLCLTSKSRNISSATFVLYVSFYFILKYIWFHYQK